MASSSAAKRVLFPAATREGLEEALRETVKWGAAQWERAEAAERELRELRSLKALVQEYGLNKKPRAKKGIGAKVSAGKRPAHRTRLERVGIGYRYVEALAAQNKSKKAAIVKELLEMSLPTYRACVEELRELAAGDAEFASALRRIGFK